MATFTGTVNTFNGKELSRPVTFTTKDIPQYDTPDAARTAGVWPNDADVLAGINEDAKRKAIASAYQDTVKRFRELYEKTVAFARQNFIDAGVAAKMPVDVVRGIAESQITETPEMAQAQKDLDALING